jgi:hypothetical protein
MSRAFSRADEVIKQTLFAAAHESGSGPKLLFRTVCSGTAVGGIADGHQMRSDRRRRRLGLINVRGEMLRTGDCYLITAPTFETKSERYGWLNGCRRWARWLKSSVEITLSTTSLLSDRNS